MSASDSNRQIPRATIHKRILDAAEAQPEASIEALAAEVPGASPDLVERVLDTYGDPTDETPEPDAPTDTDPGEPLQTDSADEPEPTDHTEHPDPAQDQETSQPATTMSDSDPDSLPEPAELTEDQRAVLRAIARHPDATQKELAEQLDVSAATINRRVNKIDGFEWANRQRIASDLLPADPSAPVSDGGPDPSTNGETGADAGVAVTEPDAETGTPTADEPAGRADDDLRARVARLETQFEAGSADAAAGDTGFDDPELTAKVVRACMRSDAITDEEELRVIEELMD